MLHRHRCSTAISITDVKGNVRVRARISSIEEETSKRSLTSEESARWLARGAVRSRDRGKFFFFFFYSFTLRCSISACSPIFSPGGRCFYVSRRKNRPSTKGGRESDSKRNRNNEAAACCVSDYFVILARFHDRAAYSKRADDESPFRSTPVSTRLRKFRANKTNIETKRETPRTAFDFERCGAAHG